MAFRSQEQQAGNNAVQYQVNGTLVVHQGLSEDAAREIARETARRAVEAFHEEALATANERIGELENRVLALMGEREQFEAFRDPAFQVALRKAQVSAASTERASDYDMLAGLISDHAARGTERTIRAGLSRAIEIVGDLDAAALRGLTLFAAVEQYTPLSGDCLQGLGVMNGLYGDLIVESPPPTGAEWIEHLDILGAVRISSVGNFKKFRDYYPGKTAGYVCKGIMEGSEELSDLASELQEVELTIDLVPHALKPGWLRAPLARSADLEQRLTRRTTEERAASARATLRNRTGIDEVDPGLLDGFMGLVDGLTHIATVRDWWDQLQPSFRLTPVGRVLARANASRLDSRGVLPPID